MDVLAVRNVDVVVGKLWRKSVFFSFLWKIGGKYRTVESSC
jgi:hypothetical protein